MKQYTHAWLAMMAIKRLEKAKIPTKQQEAAKSLVKWFKDHRDFVVQGAWYPDAIIKDMSTSHILKYQPKDFNPSEDFKKLPATYNLYREGKKSKFYKKNFTIEKGNLADRCESLTHSIVDNLKMVESEGKGSPISPTNNHVATIFFMLSHYIADAHMPLHCDQRPFSKGTNLHAAIEGSWDKDVKDAYKIDFYNERFFYDPEGYPERLQNNELCDWIEQELETRNFSSGYGTGNDNTWDFLSAITQYSYLSAYQMIPETCDANTLDWDTFLGLNIQPNFDDYSRFILIDAIDSISKVWLRAWARYQDWMKNKNKPTDDE